MRSVFSTIESALQNWWADQGASSETATTSAMSGGVLPILIIGALVFFGGRWAIAHREKLQTARDAVAKARMAATLQKYAEPGQSPADALAEPHHHISAIEEMKRDPRAHQGGIAPHAIEEDMMSQVMSQVMPPLAPSWGLRQDPLSETQAKHSGMPRPAETRFDPKDIPDAEVLSTTAPDEMSQSAPEAPQIHADYACLQSAAARGEMLNRRPVFTPAEARLRAVVQAVLKDMQAPYIVMSRLALDQILIPDVQSTDPEALQRALQGKTVQFALFDRAGRVVLALRAAPPPLSIGPAACEAQFTQTALELAGIPTLDVDPSAPAAQLKQQLTQALPAAAHKAKAPDVQRAKRQRRDVIAAE